MNVRQAQQAGWKVGSTEDEWTEGSTKDERMD
jgi:hypothetical protein